MDSSTSHSKPAVPWWALQLLAVAVATWGGGTVYTLCWNPEISFFSRGDTLKREWAAQLRTTHTNVFVVFGGSSCTTSVQPRRLLERHQLPVLNLGLHAGMGANVLARYALEALRSGDTLVVAIEPGLLYDRVDLEPLGVQFLIASGRAELLRGEAGTPWLAALLDLRPGGYHVLTMLGKILLQQPYYRYGHAEFEEGGWHNVAERRELTVSPAVKPMNISKSGRVWLEMIRDECARRKVRVACTIPWHFYPLDQLPAAQRQHLQFVREVSAAIPVLREPGLGIHPVREHFADSNVHPTSEAAALRTDELAASLHSWSLWTASEIEARMNALR